MPITSTVDHARSEIHAVATGPIHYADIEEHLQQEQNREGLSYSEFIDAREATPILSPAEVRRIVELLRALRKESRLGRTAVLVSTDYAFGLLRMLETLLEDVCQVRPFRDELEAHEWLAEKDAGKTSA
jgi:hypothetical protein